MVLAQLVNAVGRKPEDHWFESSTSLFFLDLPDLIADFSSCFPEKSARKLAKISSLLTNEVI